MNSVEHPERKSVSGMCPPLQEAQNPSGPPRWLFLLPVFPVFPSWWIAELGPLSKPSDSELDSVAVWLFQTLITGICAILLLTAWGSSLCRLRWPKDPSTRMTLGGIATATCFGWTMYLAIKGERLFGGDRGADLFAGFLVFALPSLILIVPLLWHAIVRLQQPRYSAWGSAGFLGVAVGLQCWGSTRAADDPPSFLIVNSLLIAVAVTLWLIVIGHPSVPTPAEQLP